MCKLIISEFVPEIFAPLFAPIIRCRMRSKIGSYGAYSEAEAKQLYRKDLQAASDLLGDKKFFGGDEANLVSLFLTIFI